MYTNKNENGLQELLFGAKVGGSVGVGGLTASTAGGYEYGVDSRLFPVDRPINPTNETKVDYRGFDILNLFFEGAVKTPVGNVNAGINFKTMFGF